MVEERCGCCHRNGRLCGSLASPRVILSRLATLSVRHPRAAGYRGSDFVQWHKATRRAAAATASGIGGSADAPGTPWRPAIDSRDCHGFRMPARSLSSPHAPRPGGRRSKAASERNRGGGHPYPRGAMGNWLAQPRQRWWWRTGVAADCFRQDRAARWGGGVVFKDDRLTGWRIVCGSCEGGARHHDRQTTAAERGEGSR
jgi:hypothetical protein